MAQRKGHAFAQNRKPPHFVPSDYEMWGSPLCISLPAFRAVEWKGQQSLSPIMHFVMRKCNWENNWKLMCSCPVVFWLGYGQGKLTFKGNHLQEYLTAKVWRDRFEESEGWWPARGRGIFLKVQHWEGRGSKLGQNRKILCWTKTNSDCFLP